MFFYGLFSSELNAFGDPCRLTNSFYGKRRQKIELLLLCEERIMFPTLDDVKGGGGSVRIGATGTVGSLMSRELDSVKKSPQSSKSSPRKSPTLSVSVPCVSMSTRTPRATIVDEASTCGSSSNHRSPGSTRKTRSNVFKKAHSIPMLGSDDTVVDNSPNRKKPDKKRSYIVEVVDVKCGRSNPIAHQLRKLSFSKLSERIG